MSKRLMLTLTLLCCLCFISTASADNDIIAHFPDADPGDATESYSQQVIDGLSSSTFLQLNDGGRAIKKIIEKLIIKGYLKKGYKSPVFSEEIQEAVIKFQSDHDLRCTGVMDNETLTLLLQNRKKTKTQVFVFIPTDGGKRYHGNPYCSEMAFPRVVSLENALALGFTQCRSSVYDCTNIFRFFPIEEQDINQGILDEYISFFIDALQAKIKGRNIDFETYMGKKLGVSDDEENEEVLLTNTSALDTEEAASEPKYIGNKNSHVFHKVTCTSVSDMKEKNKVVLNSREEAIERGYKPCSRCLP